MSTFIRCARFTSAACRLPMRGPMYRSSDVRHCRRVDADHFAGPVRLSRYRKYSSAIWATVFFARSAGSRVVPVPDGVRVPRRLNSRLNNGKLRVRPDGEGSPLAVDPDRLNPCGTLRRHDKPEPVTPTASAK